MELEYIIAIIGIAVTILAGFLSMIQFFRYKDKKAIRSFEQSQEIKQQKIKEAEDGLKDFADQKGMQKDLLKGPLDKNGVPVSADYSYMPFPLIMDRLNERISEIEKSLSNIKQLIVEDPESVLTVNLLKKDVELLEKRVNQIDSNQKWFFGILIALLFGVLALAISILLK